jgi:GTP-binding protein
MFIDETHITVKAGNGGDGSKSFRREKFVPLGGPDGGDGGKGGDIILKVNSNLNTLNHLAHKKNFEAKSGGNGLKKNMFGKNGENLIIEVPLGTIIYSKDKKTIYKDLNKENDTYIVCKGGRGGRGNVHFKSSTNQVPKFAEKGEPGELKEIIMELRMVADIGLIGLPSAGKSTLISVISNAKPRIAEYHFTTLSPNLGLVNMKTFGGSEKENFLVADIPGLIEGASEGKGLGIKFLKHIARTKTLIHILDASSEDLSKDYKTITKELKEFDKKLVKKEQLIVVNKIDLLDEESLKSKIKQLKKTVKKIEIVEISALTRKNIKELAFKIAKLIKEEKTEEKAEELPILRPHLEKSIFTLEKVINKDGVKTFRISGEKIEKFVQMNDTSDFLGLERFYSFIEKSGLKKLVEKKKAKFGDFYKINNIKIPYRK